MTLLIRYSALFALRDAVPKAEGDGALKTLCECLASPKVTNPDGLLMASDDLLWPLIASDCL
jgi:hypothetical protein